MRLPHDETPQKRSLNMLPKPFVFWPTTTVPTSNPNAYQEVSDIHKHNIFEFQGDGQPTNRDSEHMTAAQKQAYMWYVQKLGMNLRQNTSDEMKTPGERAIGGESCSQLLAFEGTMKVYNEGQMLEQHKMGSWHLRPSYVGVASIREGRGVLNPAALGRLI